MSGERLIVRNWSGPGFGPLDFSLSDGSFVWLEGGRPTTAVAAVDCLCGLQESTAGEVRWFGRDLAALGESGRLDLAKQIAHVRVDGGLLANLRVWENVVLPVRQRFSTSEVDDLEAEILAAFAACGRDEERAGRLLQERVEELSDGEQVLVMLVRGHLNRPEVVLCERAFGGLPDEELDECRRLLDWMATQHPGLALLVIGDEAPPDGRFGLSAWGDPEILRLEEGGPWHAS